MQQNFAHLAHKRAVRDAKNLIGRVSRIGKRAKNIKDCANTNLSACRSDMLHGRMVGQGKHKTKATFLYATGRLLRCQINLYPKRFQDVRTATFTRSGTITMLGNRNPCGGGNNTYSGRDIERPGAIPSSSTSIHGPRGRLLI